MNKRITKVKSLVFIPLAIASLIIWASYAAITYYSSNKHLQEELRDRASIASSGYQSIIDSEKQKQKEVLKNLASDTTLISALESNNRDLLLSRVLNIFQRLKSEHDTTHFYVHDTNRVNIARAHQPNRFGDTINRTSLLLAESTKNLASGLELGPLGTFTLRSVAPVWKDKKLLGYIEIGRDNDQIIKRVARIYDVDIVTVIDKHYLGEKLWQKGSPNPARSAGWDLLENNVISSNTSKQPINALYSTFSLPLNKLFQGSEKIFSLNHSAYQSHPVPLNDINGDTIGALFVLNDAAWITHDLYLTLSVTTGIMLFLGLILFVAFYFILNSVEKKQKALFNEIEMKEAHHKDAQKLARFGSWELNIKTGDLYWTDEVFNIFELACQTSELSYEIFLNLVHPDDRNYVDQAFMDSVKKGKPYNIVHRILMKDGRVKYVREVCEITYGITDKSLVNGTRDNSLIAFGFIHDITDQKKQEEKLRIASVAFETRDCMMITDSRGKILQVNQAFTKTTGYSAEEAIGERPSILSSNRQDKNFYRRMWESIEKHGQWQGEIVDRRKNGEEYPVWLNISAVKDETGMTTHYVGVHTDITARKQAQSRIRKLAFYDQLTGLPNRTLFLDRLTQAMNVSDNNDSHGALLLIDLDNFKMLNDTLGHIAGDKLLSSIGQCLEGIIRPEDTICRLGGDEFIILLCGLPEDRKRAAIIAEKVAEKIRFAINSSDAFGNTSFNSTASIGITLFQGCRSTKEELIKQADLAMYRSKSCGRNTIHFFDPSMETEMLTRMQLEKDLHLAIQEKQFLIHYQPQVDQFRQPTGAEALVRWRHPERGLVSPADFIPIAEDTGQIISIGRLVLEMACEKLADWATRPEMAHITISINVSVKQFLQSDFTDQVLSTIRATGADPTRLKLELTESLLAENVDDIIKTMKALEAVGIGFALDDFGTGYSSLSYLTRFPLQQLKVDLSFVRDMLTDKNARTVAESVILLGKSLNMEVIAEGVETDLQLEHLVDLGCHRYQGYLFSRPVPEEKFEAFVHRNVQANDKTATT